MSRAKTNSNMIKRAKTRSVEQMENENICLKLNEDTKEYELDSANRAKLQRHMNSLNLDISVVLDVV
jgi:hypothetical protein